MSVLVQRKYLKGFSDSILSEKAARDFALFMYFTAGSQETWKMTDWSKSLCAGNNGYISKLWEKA